MSTAAKTAALSLQIDPKKAKVAPSYRFAIYSDNPLILWIFFWRPILKSRRQTSAWIMGFSRIKINIERLTNVVSIFTRHCDLRPASLLDSAFANQSSEVFQPACNSASLAVGGILTTRLWRRCAQHLIQLTLIKKARLKAGLFLILTATNA